MQNVPTADRHDADQQHGRVQPETGLSVQISCDGPQQIRMGTTRGQHGLRGHRRTEIFTRVLSTVARRNQSLTAS